jgi:hypothetical protein
VDSYSLVARSPELRAGRRGGNAPVIDIRYVGVQTYLADPGFCSSAASFVYAFAITTWQRSSHANGPAEFDVFLDTNRDGLADYVVFNFDASIAETRGDGRNVTWVVNLSTGDGSAFFFTDQGTNTANTVLLFCGEQIGMSAANLGQPIDATVLAGDNMFAGAVTDAVTGLTVAPLGERFVGIFSLDSAAPTSTDVPVDASRDISVVDFGELGTNPGELGVLLLLDAARDGYRGGAPIGNEALTLTIGP